jgi:hypothetical protein
LCQLCLLKDATGVSKSFSQVEDAKLTSFLPGDPIKGPDGVEGHWVQRRDPTTNDKVGCEFVDMDKTIVASTDSCEKQDVPEPLSAPTIVLIVCGSLFACIFLGKIICRMCKAMRSKRAATPSTSSLSPAPAITRSPDEELLSIEFKGISFGEDLKFYVKVAEDDQELNKYALVKESSLEYVPPNLPKEVTSVWIQQRMHWIPNADRPSDRFPPIITYQAGNQLQRVLYYEITILKLEDEATLEFGVTRDPIPSFGLGRFGMLYISNGNLLIRGDLKRLPFCNQFGVGDVVGVGLETQTGAIFFTLNGTRLTEYMDETSQSGMIEPTFPGAQNWFVVCSDGACEFEPNHGQHSDFKWTEAKIQGWDASFEELQVAHNNETRPAQQVNSERSGTEQHVVTKLQYGNILACEQEDGTKDLVYVLHNEAFEQIVTLPLESQEVESLPYCDRDMEGKAPLYSHHPMIVQIPIQLREIRHSEDLTFILILPKDEQEHYKHVLVKESSLEYVPPNLPKDLRKVFLKQRMHWIPNSDRPTHCFPPIITYQEGNQLRRVLYCEITILKLQNDVILEFGISRDPIISFGNKSLSTFYSSKGFPFCNPFGVGDVVGVGLEIHTGTIFFTLNGTRLTGNINETSQSGRIEPTFPGVEDWFEVCAEGACEFETNHGRHGDFKWTEATIQGWDASFEELQLEHNNEARPARQVNSERSGTEGVQQHVVAGGQIGNLLACEQEDGTVDLVFVRHDEALEQIVTLPLESQEVESLPYYDRDVESEAPAYLENSYLTTTLPTPNPDSSSKGAPPPNRAQHQG